MSWTSPAELRAQVRRLWDRGAILADAVTGPTLFPRRLVLKTPSSAELPTRFEEARAWSRALGEMPHLRLVPREVRHRVLGANSLPAEAWVETPEDAVALIGRGREMQAFRALVARTREACPDVLPWLARRPHAALELAADWPRLLAVVNWLQAHPRPGIYLRQMDLPGVHTKFVETHRGVLGEILDLVLPAGAIDSGHSGGARFARRYGFLDRPERIRFRILDPARALLPGTASQDITVDGDTFAGLGGAVGQVFITENETNFLAFPAVTGSMVIFGAGYGFETLGRARWLRECRLHYWGDIDTHGFAILDALRAHFPHVGSLLMDQPTLMACEPLWGEERRPTTRDLHRLTAGEQALYDALRDQRIRPNLRLEQERIDFGRVLEALSGLGLIPSHSPS